MFYSILIQKPVMIKLPFHLIERRRLRLWSSLLLGGLCCVFLPSDWRWITKGLVSWNIGVWVYLITSVWLMSQSSANKWQSLAKQEDKSASTVLLLMSVAALFSLAAIVLELSGIGQEPLLLRLLHYGLTLLTLVGSWCLMGILFTFHYARLFYQTQHKNPNDLALRFELPRGQFNLHPSDWDFLYFSFTIATSAQTSDVSVCSQSMRKTVLGQSVLFFFFNVAILGLFINMTASLIHQLV
jgi:uncharacterized membrane protein